MGSVRGAPFRSHYRHFQAARLCLAGGEGVGAARKKPAPAWPGFFLNDHDRTGRLFEVE